MVVITRWLTDVLGRDAAGVAIGYLRPYENALMSIIAADADVQTIVILADRTRKITHVHIDSVGTSRATGRINMLIDGKRRSVIINSIVDNIDPCVDKFEQNAVDNHLQWYFNRLSNLAADALVIGAVKKREEEEYRGW